MRIDFTLAHVLLLGTFWKSLLLIGKSNLELLLLCEASYALYSFSYLQVGPSTPTPLTHDASYALGVSYAP